MNYTMYREISTLLCEKHYSACRKEFSTPIFNIFDFFLI